MSKNEKDWKLDDFIHTINVTRQDEKKSTRLNQRISGNFRWNN